jgi:hypothetical protein
VILIQQRHQRQQCAAVSVPERCDTKHLNTSCSRNSDTLGVLGMKGDIVTSLKHEVGGITKDISLLQEACDDHLLAINENTEEINNTQTSVEQIESKLEKLNARIDTMHMMFNQIMWQTKITIELNNDEQALFQVLCSHKNFLTLDFVMNKIHMNAETIRTFITSLIDKGIPVLVKDQGGQVFLNLDSEFRTLQRKHKVVKVNKAISRRYENKPLITFFSE